MSAARLRRTYPDVLRGVAVLIMIEAHVVDSWTRLADRSRHAFGYSMILGGFGAPLFMFLAGVAVALSAGSKVRRLHDPAAAARLVERRGLEIFGLAFLFRFQSFVISRTPAIDLLRVDVLNVMGPSIVFAAWLWSLGRSSRARLAIFAGATLAIVYVTPWVRVLLPVGILPGVVEGYIRPVPGLTNFSFFPWGAFLPAGAFVGELIDCSRDPRTERRLNLWLAIGGTLLAAAAYASSFEPAPFAPSEFWTTSASFFLMRVGIMTAAIAVAYAWEQRPGAGRHWAPVRLMGEHSLFVYWIHVELVYGVISIPLHHSMSLERSWIALVLFSAAMAGCVVLWRRLNTWWAERRTVTREPARPIG